jgi:hypothetical protein
MHQFYRRIRTHTNKFKKGKIELNILKVKNKQLQNNGQETNKVYSSSTVILR